MATTQQSRGLRGSGDRGFTTKRRQAGTSLVEILVVIVIFLIGILAVVQVFPRGFRLLLVSRNNSMATAIGRDEVERIKANPESVPEQILPVRYVGGVPVVDVTLDSLDLGPRGEQVTIDQGGVLYAGGQQVAANWALASGANIARHIVGEGARVPGPRLVGTLYGSPVVVEHGPIDLKSNEGGQPVLAYANDLSRNLGAPREVQTDANSAFSVAAVRPDGAEQAFNALLVKTPVTTAPYEYFAVNPSTPSASLLLPTALFDRTYRVRLSGYVGDGTASSRVEYVALSVRVPAVTAAVREAYPLVEVRLAADPNATDPYRQGAGLLNALNQIPAGSWLVGAEYDALRVAPQYVSVPVPQTGAEQEAWRLDPFRMVITDRVLGCVLFSPASREGVVQRPGGVSEPLQAKLDYDVYDWRVLREDFRFVDDPTFALALQGIKVGSQTGPDGRPNGGFWTTANNVDPSGPGGAQTYPRDNVVLIDLTTGFQVQEYDTADQADGRALVDVPTSYAGYDPARALVDVDKSRGTITLKSGRPGVTGVPGVHLVVPKELGGGVLVASPKNRTFRVLYRARNEWSVQPIRGAAHYTRVNSFSVGPGNYLVGGGEAGGVDSRIYFPRNDIGRKVTIDRIVYYTGAGLGTLEGQDFLIKAPGANDGNSLGYIDLTDLIPGAHLAETYLNQRRDPVQGVKGASLAVRVLWNPETFELGSDAVGNVSKLEQWGRNWRRSTTETYLRAEETR